MNYLQDIVLELIKEKMSKAEESGTTSVGFLIDGYPRELEQGILFEKNVWINRIIETFIVI